MAINSPDYTRLKSDKNLMVLIAPTSGATGVQDPDLPTASELVVGGSTGFLNASPSISWNDFDFGVQESERTSDPSLADDSTYEDFGQSNAGGSISFYLPADFDDNSNNHRNVFRMMQKPRTNVDIVTRLDGAKNNITRPIQDGDFVSVFRMATDSDTESVTGSEAYRRTIGFFQQGSMAPMTIVGDHTITAQEPATSPWAEGKTGRIQGIVQDRDYSSNLHYQSSDASVIRVQAQGGFYRITGSDGGTATVTITDKASGLTETVDVVVAA